MVKGVSHYIRGVTARGEGTERTRSSRKVFRHDPRRHWHDFVVVGIALGAIIEINAFLLEVESDEGWRELVAT
jgi:hypothetical protein